LAVIIKKLYAEIKIPLTKSQENALKNLACIDFYEVMHGAMLPHLGIYRMVLIAASKGLTIFFVKDEYEHDWYPEVRAIRMWLRDVPPSQQDRGIVVPIKKNLPVRYVKPPSKEQLLRLRQRIKSRYIHNINWIKDRVKLNKKEINEIMSKVNELTELMIRDAEATKNYAHFSIRLFLNILRRTNPDLYDRILFCSYLDSVNMLFKEEILSLFKKFPDHFWHYCKNLHRSKTVNCPRCGKNSIFIAPDIVAFQMMTALLAPKARIVGGIKSYSILADKLTKLHYGIEPPPRIVVGRPYPVFYGIPEVWGDTRTSVIRALFEVSYDNLGKALLNQNPILKSVYLKSQFMNKEGKGFA